MTTRSLERLRTVLATAAVVCAATTVNAQVGEIALSLRVDGDLPPPPGVEIRVDGVRVEDPDASGNATLTAAVGNHTVRAVLPGAAGASANVRVRENETTPLQLVLTAEDGLAELARVFIAEAPGGTLPEQLDSFTLVFAEPAGGVIALSSLIEAPFLQDGMAIGDFAPLFEIVNGRAVAIDLAPLTIFLTNPLELTVQALGRTASGRLVAGETTFRPSNALFNASFETTENTTGRLFASEESWCCNQSEIVSAEGGITPAHGSQMLKFIGTGETGPTSNRLSTVGQLVDLRQHGDLIESSLLHRAGSGFRFRASVRVNRIADSLDSRFRLVLAAYKGTPFSYITDQSRATTVYGSALLDTDDDPSTWERLDVEIELPGTGFRGYVAVLLAAEENVSAQRDEPEFAGHYADAVVAVLVPEPDRLSAVLTVLVTLVWCRRRKLDAPTQAKASEALGFTR